MNKKTQILPETLNNCIKKIEKLRKQARTVFNAIKIGRILHKIKTKRWFTVNYNSFESLISSSDIKFGRTNAYNFIKIYKLWENQLKRKVTGRELGKVRYKKFLIIVKEIEGLRYRTETKQWLTKARKLKRPELKQLVRKIPIFMGTAIFAEYRRKIITLSYVKYTLEGASSDTIDNLYCNKKIKFRIEVIDE